MGTTYPHGTGSTSGPLGRRRFLPAAALGGATVVGASALGGLDADAAFAAPTPPLDPAAARTSLAEGRVAGANGSTLEVAGSHGESHRIRITNATSVWKLRPTTPDAIEASDGLYARGVRMPDGSIAADAVWANIVNLHCTIRGIGRNRLELALGRRALAGHVVPGTTAASYHGAALTSDLSRLRIGQDAQVLGAWRPSDDSVDTARLDVGR